MRVVKVSCCEELFELKKLPLALLGLGFRA